MFKKIITSLGFLVLIIGCTPDEGSGYFDYTPPFVPSGIGGLTGNVRDAGANLPSATVTLFDSSSVELDVTTTNATGDYSFADLDAAEGYSLVFSLTNFKDVTFENVTVYSDEDYVVEVVNMVDSALAGTGDISGTIVDARTGAATATATSTVINIREGMNIRDGTILNTLPNSVDAIGNYSIAATLATGNYTLEFVLGGYANGYINVYVVAATTIANQSGTMFPASTGTSIVLTWGASPADLDSHMTGPNYDNAPDTDAGRFHVYYPTANRGSLTAEPFVNLDVDDVSSYGPETITLASQFLGIYRYSILDFTNGGGTAGTALSTSGAKIDVYREGLYVRSYNVPSGAGGLWNVFQLDGTELFTINTIESTTTIP